jgi:Family of unknown function (DUF5678)
VRDCAVAVSQFTNYRGRWDAGDEVEEPRRRMSRHDPAWGAARTVSYEPSIKKPNIAEWEYGSESSSSLENTSGTWIAANSEELSKKYAGQWVLIDHSHLVAAASTPADLQRIVVERGMKTPTIFKVAPPSTKGVAKAVYAGQIVRYRNPVS